MCGEGGRETSEQVPGGLPPPPRGLRARGQGGARSRRKSPWRLKGQMARRRLIPRCPGTRSGEGGGGETVRPGHGNLQRFSAPVGGGEARREGPSPRGRCPERGSLRARGRRGQGRPGGGRDPSALCPEVRAAPSLPAPPAGARPSVPVFAGLGQGLSWTLTHIPEGARSPRSSLGRPPPPRRPPG